MGRNNLQLVGVGLCVVLVCIFVVIAVLHTKDKIQNHNDSDELISDDSFKPMIKVGDEIYLWTGDIEVDLEELEKIGEVQFSYETIGKGIDEDDQNFSSNICEKGAEIYKYDDSNIIISGDGYTSSFEKGDW